MAWPNRPQQVTLEAVQNSGHTHADYQKQSIDYAFLSPNAFHLTRTPTDVGYSLTSAYHYQLLPSETLTIYTDICMLIPNGVIAWITNRPGISLLNDYSIQIVTSPLPVGYIPNVGITVVNQSKVGFTIHPGQQLATLIFLPEAFHHMQYFPVLTDSPRFPKLAAPPQAGPLFRQQQSSPVSTNTQVGPGQPSLLPLSENPQGTQSQAHGSRT